MAFNRKLLDIMACPKCKGEILLTDKEDGLICNQCRLLYKIDEHGIPCMIIDEAVSLDDLAHSDSA